jgi:hypothetical protein
VRILAAHRDNWAGGALMGKRMSDVCHVVTMQLVLADGTAQAVIGEFSYAVNDPYTVRAFFSAPNSASTWLIGRELLSTGLRSTISSPAGKGDVQVWRDEDPSYALMSLDGVEGNALLATPAIALERFLASTVALVPFGDEGALMDAELTDLIAMLFTP